MLEISCFHALQNTMYYLWQQVSSKPENDIKATIMEAGQDLSEEDFMVKVWTVLPYFFLSLFHESQKDINIIFQWARFIRKSHQAKIR
jgi:hypothetical protein